MSKLTEIQNEIKANKGNYNSFGNYYYRSAEDIQQAIKPLLLKHGCQLVLTDDIINVGDRIYVKATAIFTDGEKEYKVSAFAREDLVKKGMSESQITGASSSYARKYCLSGLLLLDDSKDDDSHPPKESKDTSKDFEKTILSLMDRLEKTLDRLGKDYPFNDAQRKIIDQAIAGDLSLPVLKEMVDKIEKL